MINQATQTTEKKHNKPKWKLFILDKKITKKSFNVENEIIKWKYYKDKSKQEE